MNSSASKLVVSTHPVTNFTAYIDQTDGEVFITDSSICDILGIEQEILDILLDRCDEPKPENRIQYYPELATIGGIQRISGLRNAIDFVAILRVYFPVEAEGKEYKEEMLYELAEHGVIDHFYHACGRADLARPIETPEFEMRMYQQKMYEEKIAALEKAILGLEAVNAQALDLARTLVAERKHQLPGN